jgi:hypothetical protein
MTAARYAQLTATMKAARQGAFERALALSPLDPVDNGLK